MYIRLEWWGDGSSDAPSRSGNQPHVMVMNDKNKYHRNKGGLREENYLGVLGISIT